MALQFRHGIPVQQPFACDAIPPRVQLMAQVGPMPKPTPKSSRKGRNENSPVLQRGDANHAASPQAPKGRLKRSNAKSATIHALQPSLTGDGIFLAAEWPFDSDTASHAETFRLRRDSLPRSRVQAESADGRNAKIRHRNRPERDEMKIAPCFSAGMRTAPHSLKPRRGG